MSGRIQFVVNDVSLQLYEDFDESFWITRQVHDLKNLETRNASTTKNITIPAVPNNLFALGLELSLFDVPSQAGVKKIPCNILIDDIEVVNQGDLLVTSVTGKYISMDVSLLWGNFDFFELVKKININDLDYSDLDLNWQLSNLQLISQNTSGIVFCADEWIDAQEWRDLSSRLSANVRLWQDIKVNGCWLYTKDILERIAAFANYTIDDTGVNWNRWNTVAIAIAVHQWVEIGTKVNPYSGNILKATNETQTNTAIPIRTTWDGTVTDPFAQWSVPSNAWIINTGTDPNRTINFRAIMNIVHTQQNPTGTPYVAIRLNGVNVFTNNFPANFTGTVTMTTQIIVVTGDTVDTVAFAPDGPGANGSTIQILAANSQFDMTEFAGTDPGPGVIIQDYVPEISAEKFLTSICNLANVIISTDRGRRVVNFISFDNILDSEAQDLSKKLVQNLPIDSSNIIDSYFQLNFFNYAKRGPILRNDTNGQTVFRNELLDLRGDLITLDFDACDDALWYLGAATASFYGKELDSLQGINVTVATNTFTTTNVEQWNIGDYLEINTTGSNIEVLRIIGQLSPTQGVVTSNWQNTAGGSSFPFTIHRHSHGNDNVIRLANINQTPSTISVTDGNFLSGAPGVPTQWPAFVAEFDTEMKFQYLVDTEYERMLKVLDIPFVVRGWFQLTVTEYLELSILRLVYVNFFDSVYYVNKMEQYKLDKPVRIELIKAKSF